MSAHSDAPIAKICGLRDARAARAATLSGAWALGFILAPSRRQVVPEDIASIRAELSRDSVVVPPMVGVTVNASVSEIRGAIAIAGLDMVQLAGDELPGIVQYIDIPVIKALRFEADTSLEDALHEVDRWTSGVSPVDYVIVEGRASGSFGGTGTKADWTLAARLAEEFPIILAGGLNPENVRTAIQQVKPWGVDVSSGAEKDGVKDPSRIRAFLDAAHGQSG